MRGKKYNATYARTNSEKAVARATRWRRANPNSRKIDHRRRMLEEVNYQITHNLRGRLYQAIKHNHKTGSAVRDLGCSIDQFKKYIEDQFELGMSWENWGEWHLDHILPLSSFDLTNAEQFSRAVNYKNHRPLWRTDNLRKGNRLIVSPKNGE